MTNFAQLGIEIESKDAVTAATNLDNMAAAGKRAEKVTDDLKKSTTDWAAEQAKANARGAEMAAQDAKRAASAQKANASIRDQQKELGKLLGSIDPAVAALGRLDEQERKLAQFRKSGAIDSDTFAQYNKRLQDQRSILGGVADAQGKAGMSTRAYSAAMRNVPAQITDITTSLIGGQPAYLVALQQGGQLKDMFGGIGPAARALATTLAGMINPVTLLAAGVAAMALAWKQSADDAFEFNKALILTGNYADKTDEQLSRMASRLDTIGGVTASSARSALLAVANTGKFTGEQFDLVATSAARMEGSVGVSVDQTVAKFVEIGKAPVDALVKLNDAEHFLTQAQLERVQALVAEGREQEAVAVATRLYADNIDLVASRAEAALPTISRWWRGVKDETSGAWNELKIYMNLVAEAIELKSKFFSGGNEPGFASNFASSFLPSNRLRFLNSAMRDRNGSARGADFSDVTGRAIEPRAQSAQQIAAQAAWKQTLATTDKVLARKIAIDEIERKGVAAGISRVEIEKQVAAYKKQQADIDAKKGAAAARSDISQAQSLIDSANRQIEANKQLADSGETVSASRRKIIEIDQRLTEAGNLMTASQRQQLDVAKQQLEATDRLAQSRQQLTRDTAANAALEERLAAASRQQREQNEVGLMGIGRGGDAAAMAQRQLDIRRDYLRQIDALEKAQRNANTALSAAELQKEKDMLSAHLQSQLALEQSYQQQRMTMMGDWRNGLTASFEDFSAQAADVAGSMKNVFDNALNSTADAIANFVTSGKFSFKDLANSIISDLARVYAKQVIVGLITQIAGGGYADGGYTGDGGKHQPAGTVHKGEVVWSQADVKAVGGPRAANAMRPTAGYVNGGIVGQSQSRTIGQANAPQVTFIMNMQDGSISTQQQGQGDDSTRELKNMFEAMINQWWARNNRPGGAVYNGRMGTA